MKTTSSHSHDVTEVVLGQQADVAEVVTNDIKLIKVKLGHTVVGCGIFDFVKRDDELAGRTVLVAIELHRL
jgi:hypothetical protein